MAHSYYPNFADKITIPEANKSIPVLLIHGSKNKKVAVYKKDFFERF